MATSNRISSLLSANSKRRNPRRHRRQVLRFEPLEGRQLLASAPIMLQDINEQSNIVTNIEELTRVGNTLYFTSDSSQGTSQLWKSNGTDAGTTLVKDLGPRTEPIQDLFNYNGTLVFSAYSSTSGRELWKSDGTSQGTVMVRDISQGATSSNPRHFTTVNGVLYFFATTEAHGKELWKSNGTTEGTTLVRDINPGTSSSYGQRSMANVNGILYFNADNGTNGRELWKSNGTTAGTVMVRDIAPGAASSFPSNLINVNGALHFTVSSGAPSALWRSFGQSATTAPIASIGSDPDNFVVMGSSLYFTTSNDRLLKVTNGAFQVIGEQYDELSELTVVNDKLFFTTNEVTNSRGLYVTDGTTEGISRISISSTEPRNPRQLTNWNGTLYFNFSPVSGNNLVYQSAGTSATTTPVSWMTGVNTQFFTSGIAVGNTWYFTRRSTDPDFSGSDVLWKTNGTAASTREVKQIETESATPSQFTEVDGKVFFAANDGIHGRELWVIDTYSSTTNRRMVTDLFPGAVGSNPDNLTAFQGRLYFTATTFAGTELWRTDGTESGTVLMDLLPGLPSSSPSNLVVVGPRLYFSAFTTANGRELWQVLSLNQPSLVRDIRPGSDSSSPMNLTNHNGTLYFSANDGINGVELWKSNGTSASTELVRNISRNSFSSNPAQLTTVGNQLFFQANNAINGTELWVTDGTSNGTALVQDINLQGSSNPVHLTNVDGILYFQATTPTSGQELWRSDGTSAGTFLVRDIFLGSSSSSPTSLVNVNGNLFFRATGNGGDTELWKSDGTSIGTVRVKNIHPTGSSSPTQLTNIAGFLYFRANDGVNGNELWRSNGSEAGTDLVANLAPGTASSNPSGFVRSGQFLYFAAFDELYGTEVYFQDLIPASIGNDSLTIRYSPSDQREQVVVQRNTTRGAVVVGTFAANETLQLRGGNGNDSLNFVGSSSDDIFDADDGYVLMNQFAIKHDSSSSWETISFSGGTGSDLYQLTPDDGTDTTFRIVESGNDVDWLDFQMSAEPVVVNLGITSVQTTAGGALKLQLASASNIEGIMGSNFDDTLIGNALNNRILGFAGNDILRGNFGSDELSGGSGSDTYLFGNAILAENDLISEGITETENTISFAPATDPVTIDLSGASSQSIMQNRNLTFSPSLFANLIGGSGNDKLTGNSGDNTLDGGPGNDLLIGRQGNDIYRFESAALAEADQVSESSNQGVDTISFQNLSTDVTFALNINTVQQAHTNRTLKLNGPSNFENLIGGSGNDVLTGNGMSNLIIGNDGNDQIDGLNNRDVLIGGQGSDTIEGGLDEDILIAGRTIFDATPRAFDAVMAEWKSSTNQLTRILNIRAGVGTPATPLIATSTVLDDSGNTDELIGEAGNDWFFRALNDLITDLSAEVIDSL